MFPPAKTLWVVLCAAFPTLIRATLVHSGSGSGCISVNEVGTCDSGPPNSKKPVNVSPSKCGSGDCEFTITIAYGFGPYNKDPTALPGYVVQEKIHSSWSDVVFSYGFMTHCMARGDGSSAPADSNPLTWCSEHDQPYEQTQPLANPYHLLAGYHSDESGNWVPNSKSEGDSSSSSSGFPTNDEQSAANNGENQATDGTNLEPIAANTQGEGSGLFGDEEVDPLIKRRPVEWSG